MLVTQISTSGALTLWRLAAYPHQSGGSPALLFSRIYPRGVKGSYHRVRSSMSPRDRDLRGREPWIARMDTTADEGWSRLRRSSDGPLEQRGLRGGRTLGWRPDGLS